MRIPGMSAAQAGAAHARFEICGNKKRPFPVGNGL